MCRRAARQSGNIIRVRGARQNNLRNVDLDLAQRSLVVVVGVSGSGKSSLVFDTIAAEAQRQINSTFSAFAQNYLPSYGRPDVDLLENLSAAVVIEQRRLVGGPRSTVATFTDIGDWMRMLWSRGATPHAGYSFAFSFNDPAGMCSTCHGLGREKALDVDAFLDDTRSLREGPFRHPDYKAGSLAWRRYADSGLFDIDVPLEQYSTRERHLLLEAEPGEAEPTGPHALPGPYEGVLLRFKRIQLAKDPMQLKGEARKAYDRLVTEQRCTDCGGTRLNAAARTAHISGLTLPAAYAMQVSDLHDTMRSWDPGALRPVVEEITTQLGRLAELGLGYLSLDRATATLSGGEAQRVRMVGHLGSTLNDMLYVFDEPTTGLHPRDVDRLAQLLIALRDKGNTVLVVEHDPAIMAIADQVVEIGPAPGPHGGRLTFQGSFEQLRAADTPTGRALRTRHVMEREPRTATGRLRIEQARDHFTDTRLVRLHTTAAQVGLGYVRLGQNLTTLSGGERQRLKLARELTAGAEIIVLDEPTTGLHPTDTGRLLELLHRLVDDGRTVIVIEHDLDVIAAADHVIDLGPDGGHNGGRVQFTGSVAGLAGTNTHTGEYLRRHLQPRPPSSRP